MKRLILMTALATLLPVGAASAWPGRPSDPPMAGDPAAAEPDWRSERDRGYDTYDTHWDRGFHDHWVTLSAFTPARKGRETVNLVGRDRKIDRLRIQAVRGAPVVTQVIIQYRNGAYVRMPVNKQLRPGENHMISLDRHRRIERVMVLTDSRVGGAYSLYGAG